MEMSSWHATPIDRAHIKMLRAVMAPAVDPSAVYLYEPEGHALLTMKRDTRFFINALCVLANVCST